MKLLYINQFSLEIEMHLIKAIVSSSQTVATNEAIFEQSIIGWYVEKESPNVHVTGS